MLYRKAKRLNEHRHEEVLHGRIEQMRRTTKKQRMWAHAVEGRCTACNKTINKADVLDRAKAQARMSHSEQLKHAADHFGVLPEPGSQSTRPTSPARGHAARFPPS